jgi:hypothetical protein
MARESVTMATMVGIYCEANHEAPRDTLCRDCREFLDYAERRLQKCPYGDSKPTCSNCPIHCYKPARRAYAKNVMRYAGPRMLRRRPLLAIAHVIDGFRKVNHPKESGRKLRLRSKRK